MDQEPGDLNCNAYSSYVLVQLSFPDLLSVSELESLRPPLSVMSVIVTPWRKHMGRSIKELFLRVNENKHWWLEVQKEEILERKTWKKDACVFILVVVTLYSFVYFLHISPLTKLLLLLFPFFRHRFWSLRKSFSFP